MEKGQLAPICELHKLWKAVQQKDSATNTVIAISGFMSKNSDKSEEWKEFTDYFVQQKLYSNTYALNWEAKNPDEIWEEKGKDMAVSALTGGLALLAAAKVSKTQLAAAGFNAAKGLIGSAQTGKSVFMDAKKSAKLSGKLLACALALSYPFGSHNVSLIGFSLGSQVTKSCIKYLHQFGARLNGKFSFV